MGTQPYNHRAQVISIVGPIQRRMRRVTVTISHTRHARHASVMASSGDMGNDSGVKILLALRFASARRTLRSTHQIRYNRVSYLKFIASERPPLTLSNACEGDYSIREERVFILKLRVITSIPLNSPPLQFLYEKLDIHLLQLRRGRQWDETRCPLWTTQI